MSRESIIEWYNVHKGKGIIKFLFSKHNKDILTEVYALTPMLDDSFTILTRLYWIVNGITEFPKCKVCGKEMRRNILSMSRKYADCCSDKCRGIFYRGHYKGIPNEVRIEIAAEKNENKRKMLVLKKTLEEYGDSVVLGSGIEVVGLGRINRSQNIHHLIYKMVNKVNGHYYIGRHSTINPLDDYYGSGVALSDAIRKYGLKQFRKEILGDFETYEKACIAEAELVPEEKCHMNNPQCYNLTSGGRGGIDSHIGKRCAATRMSRGYRHSEATRKLQSERAKGIPKSSSHKRSLSLNHRTRRIYHVLYETTGVIKERFGTIPAIAKENGISNAQQLKRCSHRGEFYQGIKILDIVKPEEEYYHKLSKTEKMYTDPITGDSVSWYTLRRRKGRNERYKDIKRIEEYIKEEFKFKKEITK